MVMCKDGPVAFDVSIDGGDTAQPLNLRKRVAVVARWAGPLAGKILLDCGCGAGGYSQVYAAEGARVVGIDYDESKVTLARRHLTETGAGSLVFARGDLERLPLPNACADAAVLNEVLEHIPDEFTALAELRRVLRPGGMLVVMSPNRFFPFESHGVRRRGGSNLVPPYLPFVPYIPIVIGRRVFDYWARNYWPHELRRLVASAGFEVVETGYVAQTFENISGYQPRAIRLIRPALRSVIEGANRVPIARAVSSVSQLVVARVAG